MNEIFWFLGLNQFLDPNFSFGIGLKEFPHPKQKLRTRGRDIQVLVNFGAMFFFATSMFGFVFQVHSLVLEKELKLRQVKIYPLLKRICLRPC